MSLKTFLSSIFQPQQAQADIDTKFNHAVIALHNARLSGNKTAARAALATMRTLAKQGQRQAAVAVRIANTPTKIAAMAKKAASDLAAVGSHAALLFGGVLVLAAWAYGKGRS